MALDLAFAFGNIVERCFANYEVIDPCTRLCDGCEKWSCLPAFITALG